MSYDKVLCLWRTFLSKIVIQGSWNIKIWPSFKDCILKWSKIDLALKTLVSSRSPSEHKQVRTNWWLLTTGSTCRCQSGEQDDDADAVIEINFTILTKCWLLSEYKNKSIQKDFSVFCHIFHITDYRIWKIFCISYR